MRLGSATGTFSSGTLQLLQDLERRLSHFGWGRCVAAAEKLMQGAALVGQAVFLQAAGGFIGYGTSQSPSPDKWLKIGVPEVLAVRQACSSLQLIARLRHLLRSFKYLPDLRGDMRGDLRGVRSDCGAGKVRVKFETAIP